MAKKDKETVETPEEILENTEVTEEVTPEAAPEVDPWEEKYNAERDAHLRVAAEFDNFRKRTIKEKEASYGNGKADAVAKMLPVYDNLERALNQPTEDAAYKKGVELTMNELVKILTGLGVEIFGNLFGYFLDGSLILFFILLCHGLCLLCYGRCRQLGHFRLVKHF